MIKFLRKLFSCLYISTYITKKQYINSVKLWGVPMSSNYCNRFFLSILNLFFGVPNKEFIVHTVILILKIMVCFFSQNKNNETMKVLCDFDFTYIFWQYVAVALAHNIDKLEVGNFELRKWVSYACIFVNTKGILEAFADSGVQVPATIVQLIDALRNYFVGLG